MWCFSDPQWWIDQIHCVLREEPTASPWTNLDEYFDGLGERQVAVYHYLKRKSDLKPDAVRRSLFYAKALKKWQFPLHPGHAQTRRDKAIAGYIARNEAAAADDYIPYGGFAARMRRYLLRWLPDKECDLGRFGPGACEEHIYHPQRFCLLDEWCALSEHWPETRIGLPSRDQSATCRLCAVPKDFDKDRLITVEPVYETFAQQMVRHAILESIHSGPLRGTCMDLGYTDGQSIQRGLALSASKFKDRATIDLSDASDGISWDAVRTVFPSWVVSLLETTRSEYFHAPGYPGWSFQQNIFAGMGNATTFAVETLFFSAFVRAYADIYCPGNRNRWVSTFGDDIICSSEVASKLAQETFPFFRVNRLKSFLADDCLRESCGIFAYNGADVTVPKVNGFGEDREGFTGLVDFQRRLRGDADLSALSERIVSVGRHHIPNYPFIVVGGNTFCESRVPYDVLPPLRFHQDRQVWQARISVSRQKTVSYPKSDCLVDSELDSETLGLDTEELARRWQREYAPPARVWYTAALAGLIGCESAVIEPTRVRRSEDRVSFPLKGSFRSHKDWRDRVPFSVWLKEASRGVGVYISLYDETLERTRAGSGRTLPALDRVDRSGPTWTRSCC